MPKTSTQWLKQAGSALLVGLTCHGLSACGGSGEAAAPVNVDPQVSSFTAIAQLARRAEGTPPDRPEDLTGLDTDNNGIRDDIDAYIVKRAYSQKQKKAVEQLERSLQKDMLADTSSRDAVMKGAEEGMRAVKCLGAQDSPQYPRFMHETVETYSKLTVNTPGRARMSRALDHALSGRGIHFPKGDTCED